MDYILRVSNLEKSFNQHRILHHISFKCQRGKIVGLIGANGAGKTTIMKAILGLIKYKGEIKIENKIVAFNQSAGGKTVGALIEYPGLYPFLTGKANLKIFSLNRNSQELDSIISEFKMEEFINNKVKAYSLGMKQKLGIALALINKPKLVILDEPMNGLDPQATHDLRNSILRRAKKGTTFLISSHVLSEIQKLVDDLIVINQGHILKSEPMSKLLFENSKGIILKTSNDLIAKEKLKEMGYELENSQQIKVIINKNKSIEPAIEHLAQENIFVKDMIHQEDLENTLLSLIKKDAGEIKK